MSKLAIVRARAARVKARLWPHRFEELCGVPEMERRGDEFVRLRDAIRQAGTDSLEEFGNGYTHTGGLSLQQNPDEFAALCLFLKERAPFENYLEIGTASGGACLLLWREVGFTNVFSIDDGLHPRAAERGKNLGRIPNSRLFTGDSHSEDARAFLARNLRGRLDVAFIDGDHSYEGVWQDVHLALPFCRNGALLIFHDTVACDGVRKVWRRCVAERLVRPLAEFVGGEKPLGLGVGATVRK